MRKITMPFYIENAQERYHASEKNGLDHSRNSLPKKGIKSIFIYVTDGVRNKRCAFDA